MMQFTHLLSTTALLLAMCFNSDSHQLGPEWIFLEPSVSTEFETSGESKPWKVHEATITDSANLKKKSVPNKNDQSVKILDRITKRIDFERRHYPETRKNERSKREYRLDMDNENENLLNEDTEIIQVEKDHEPVKNSNGFFIGDTVPILILKIRLSLMQKAAENEHSFTKRFSDNLRDFDPPESNVDNEMKETVPEYPVMDSINPVPAWRIDPEIKTIYITRGRLPTSQTPINYNQLSSGVRLKEKGQHEATQRRVSKRIFSFLSRMQGINANELEHRRLFLAYGGFPPLDRNGDIVSAETRAFIRPPGSPLRWG